MFGLLCEVLQSVVFKQIQLITLHKICVTKITNCINVHRKSYFGRLNRYLNPLLSFTGLGWTDWGLFGPSLEFQADQSWGSPYYRSTLKMIFFKVKINCLTLDQINLTSFSCLAYSVRSCNQWFSSKFSK